MNERLQFLFEGEDSDGTLIARQTKFPACFNGDLEVRGPVKYLIRDFSLSNPVQLEVEGQVVQMESGWLHHLPREGSSRVVRLQNPEDFHAVAVNPFPSVDGSPQRRGALLWVQEGTIYYHEEVPNGFYDIETRGPLNNCAFLVSNRAALVYLSTGRAADFVTLSSPGFYEGMETVLENGDPVDDNPGISRAFWTVYSYLTTHET